MAPGSWTLKHDTVTSNTALVAVACPIVKPILATASRISRSRLSTSSTWVYIKIGLQTVATFRIFPRQRSRPAALHTAAC